MNWKHVNRQYRSVFVQNVFPQQTVEQRVIVIRVLAGRIMAVVSSGCFGNGRYSIPNAYNSQISVRIHLVDYAIINYSYGNGSG